ncbi:MAG TPA: MarR family transcriptional regulator [Galbitalea sp.]|jgi:DNA-binding MarR family transcriptional regulator|nr:MarR family transcriptional regulator [Galbitalea sp.]
MDRESAGAMTSPAVDALVQLSFAVQLVLTRAAADHDLSVTQLRLLGILRDRTPSMAEIADYLELDRSSVSGLVDRAESRGLVSRRTADHDARVTLVELTSHGLTLGARIAESVSSELDALLAAASAADRASIEKLAASVAETRASVQRSRRASQ